MNPKDSTVSVGFGEAARIAIVTPWFGADLRGGAEQQGFQLAKNLAEHGYLVDVLTTCCASFSDDWSRNALRVGVERSGNLRVHRFKTRKRERRAFDRVNAILLERGRERLPHLLSPIGDADAAIFYEENINAPGLLEHLRDHGREYRSVIFIPYLYGTTLTGLPLVADRAFLQPCLHDEPYAYLQRVRENVVAARGILFNSEGELELAIRLYGPGIIAKSAIVGEGVITDASRESHAQHVRGFVPYEHAYVLYLGRQDETKNLGTLLQAWREFKRRRPTSRLQLVLAGAHASSNSNSLQAIVDVGSVSTPEKNALLANCVALAQPSLNESFSRVLYEAWAHGRATIVHADCLATATAVRASDGGLVAGTVPEWEAALQWIDDATPTQLSEIGERGRLFADENASWTSVISRYERALGLVGSPEDRSAERPVLMQRVPDDENARTYAAALAGALAIDPSTAATCGATLHVTHVVSGSSLGEETLGEREIGAIVVHPARHDGRDASDGTDALQTMADAARSVFASTPQALDDLHAAGFTNAKFAPIVVDPRAWDIVPDRVLADALQDGKQNLLYVGALIDGAHLDRLMIAFLHYLTLEREARLTIVGTGIVDEELYKHLLAEVRRLDLIDHILITRNLAGPAFVAVFRAADLFVSLDEAEHLGEALLQAMWFDVPILVAKNQIAEALVRDSGLIVTDSSDLFSIAALAQLIVIDPVLRTNILRAQRVARVRFDSASLRRQLVPWPDARA